MKNGVSENPQNRPPPKHEKWGSRAKYLGFTRVAPLETSGQNILINTPNGTRKFKTPIFGDSAETPHPENNIHTMGFRQKQIELGRQKYELSLETFPQT